MKVVVGTMPPRGTGSVAGEPIDRAVTDQVELIHSSSAFAGDSPYRFTDITHERIRDDTAHAESGGTG